MDEPEPRYIADCMLGRLARWLRILGYDVVYERRIADEALIGRALAEGRVLLTRDTRLARRRALRGAGVLLIESDRPADQLVEMARLHGVRARAGRLLTRCLDCNEPNAPVSPESVRGQVPPYVAATQTRFARCPACGKIYWRATHVEDMVRRLARLPGAT